MTNCKGCGVALPPTIGTGRPRKWCSDTCRKRQYDLACADCGVRINGTTPSRLKDVPRCADCSRTRYWAEHKRWTQDSIITAIQKWADVYGESPAQPDWHPPTARRLNDEARARRFEDARGEWPWLSTVAREFGSWNAAIVAAGFAPRARYGGGSNRLRARNCRQRTAA